MRPVFAYDVDLQVTDTKSGAITSTTRTEQAYSVLDACTQATFNVIAEAGGGA